MKYLPGSSKTIILVTALLLGSWLVILSSVDSANQKDVENYLETQLSQLDSEIASITITYENFADYIFDQAINKREIISILEEAAETDSAGKHPLRSEMYAQLHDVYEAMQRHEFKELQFHLADGESFYRFSSPVYYGDNAFVLRDSVRLAITEERPVRGFEVGGNFYGYRFVYPLRHFGNTLGSAEISVSMSAAIDTLETLYPDHNILFILDKDTIDERILKDYYFNYIVSPLLIDYYIDLDLHKKIFTESRNYLLYYNEDIISQIRLKSRAALDEGAAAAFTIDTDGKHYQARFLPVKDVLGETAGYFVSVREDEQLKIMHETLNRQQLLITLIFALILVFFISFERDKRKLRELATRDSLTGLYNRRYFEELATMELNRNTRSGNQMSVLMIDLDDFKEINDRFGHNEGDRVLTETGRLLTSLLRNTDLLARWGGEEFVILLPETSISEAEAIAERLRRGISNHDYGEHYALTISVGVTTSCRDDELLGAIIDRADRAMYRAKDKGKNRIWVLCTDSL